MTCGRFWMKMKSEFLDRLFRNSSVIQFIKFGIIGFSNTVLSYILYLVFLYLFEKTESFPEYDYLVSSVFTFCICTVWSFYWNNRFTFRQEEGERRNRWKVFARTVVSYSFTGLFLHNVLLYALVEWFGIWKKVVPLINLVVTVPLNFILHKYWAFRSKG